MSRVDEALRRAASVPRLAGTVRPAPDRSLDRVDPSALDLYPAEKPARQTPAAVEDPPPVANVAPVNVAPAVASVAPADRENDQLHPARFAESYRSKLIVDSSVSPASVEQYRRLAATVHHLQSEHGLKRLMVSSALPKEGKTLTIVNLAMTLSESYKRRVLLIDGDLRRPSVHHVFGLSNEYGLFDALHSDSSAIELTRVA